MKMYYIQKKINKNNNIYKKYKIIKLILINYKFTYAATLNIYLQESF